MKTKDSKFSGFLLIAAFVVPLLIAIVMYSLRGYLPTMKPVSHGELIHPAQPIEAIEVNFIAGGSSDLEFLKGKWTYFFYAPGQCGLECEAALFKLRQTKIATGRETNRVQSAIIIDHISASSEALSRYKSIKAATLPKIKFENTSELNLEPGVIYLIDPNGNMMMKYDDQATSKGLLKDIKKLLKISNIG